MWLQPSIPFTVQSSRCSFPSWALVKSLYFATRITGNAFLTTPSNPFKIRSNLLPIPSSPFLSAVSNSLSWSCAVGLWPLVQGVTLVLNPPQAPQKAVAYLSRSHTGTIFGYHCLFSTLNRTTTYRRGPTGAGVEH